jgi:hypothetical protein
MPVTVTVSPACPVSTVKPEPTSMPAIEAGYAVCSPAATAAWRVVSGTCLSTPARQLPLGSITKLLA